ncbi:SEL1-like repeat protein [Pedomonas mirosovicensis]|uniref:SEL1-like repeat protein n=1 Tax=Pedomonas mirosovicensis TaxID=2908641 RepID=UPI00216A4BA6|nr:SEL1-like repeat protein [Pedomonas mirosovicensis]MCH8686436.1 SEL1-like repeat protein [Pedomonas mirosovicensis]
MAAGIAARALPSWKFARRVIGPLLLPALLLAACARPPVCQGEAPAYALPGASAPIRALALLNMRSMENLACWAERNDQLAQYALGIAYEHGLGVPADRKAAMRYYRAAAASVPGRIWVYSPPVGKESMGRVIPVDTGPGRTGLPEARAALERLTASRDNGDRP